jgi:protein-S-isoprenylcysteine O-methyltransferase Ste14
MLTGGLASDLGRRLAAVSSRPAERSRGADPVRARLAPTTAIAAPHQWGRFSMHVVDIVILIGWLGFWLYWLSASVGVKAGRGGWTRFAGCRVAVFLIVLLLLRLRVFKGHAVVTNPWLEGAGLAIFVLGLALAVWARVYIGRNWGMPMSRKVDPELVTTGPYHTIRHPIYSGIILGMIGTAIAVSWYWFTAAAVIGAYFLYSAVTEERYMAELFPAAYPEYKRSTKMLVPFIL